MILAVAAALVGRGTVSVPALGGFGTTTEVRQVSGVIGSEKRAFFEDPEVRKTLARHGLEVTVDTAGSRRIATAVDLSNYDFAFPSSAPAGERIISREVNRGVFTPFHSPMAVATFIPVLEVLEREGVARQEEDHRLIDMARFVELAGSGQRWRDLEDQTRALRIQFGRPPGPGYDGES